MQDDPWAICSIEGCNKLVDRKGWCNAHYLKFYKTHPDYKPRDIHFNGEKRSHPFYMLWFERKQGGYLCEEWLDFKTFVKDISPKPEGNFFLLRIDGKKPFGPDNFRWQEHLKRKEGESKKDWWARKRIARIAANPSMERDRNLKRVFGLTREQYGEKLKIQNFVCAICEEPETTADARTGTIRNLAVDHCHNSNKIRELLCWRCNGTLGKVEDNIELLQKMINYLNKHKEV
jgi:recombination endonuclease VII